MLSHQGLLAFCIIALIFLVLYEFNRYKIRGPFYYCPKCYWTIKPQTLFSTPPYTKCPNCHNTQLSDFKKVGEEL